MPHVFDGSVRLEDVNFSEMDATINGSVDGDDFRLGAVTLDGVLGGVDVVAGDITLLDGIGNSIRTARLTCGDLDMTSTGSLQDVQIDGLTPGRNPITATGKFRRFSIQNLIWGEPETASNVVALTLTDVEDFYISGVIYSPGQHGVLLDGCVKGVLDVYVENPSGQTTNTYDGFSLTGSCDMIKLDGAMYSDGHLGGVRFPRYGVDVGASCTDITICMPIVGAVTGEINDQTSGEVDVCVTEKATGVGGTDTQSQSLSDPGTATSTGTFRLYFPNDATITSVTAALGTAPTGQSYLVDVNKNGVTIFTTQSNRPTIAAGTNFDAATLDVVDITAGDYLTIDIDQGGSGVFGADLVVNIEWVT